LPSLVFDEGPALLRAAATGGPATQKVVWGIHHPGHHKAAHTTHSRQIAAYSTLVSHPHRSHHHAFSRQAPIIPVSATAAKTADLSTVNPSYISGNRSGSNTSINSVGSTTSSVSHFKSGYVQPSSSTYSTNTLGRMTKAIRNRYRRTSGPSAPSTSYGMHSTPNTPAGNGGGSAATTPTNNMAYAVYYNSSALTATASQGEIYHSSGGRWRYRSARGGSKQPPPAYAFQSAPVPARRSSHGDLTSSGSSSGGGSGMFHGDCGGGFRYSSTEDLFEQAANRSRQNSLTDLTGEGGGGTIDGVTTPVGAASSSVYGSNSTIRQRFLFGSGTTTPTAGPASLPSQSPVVNRHYSSQPPPPPPRQYINRHQQHGQYIGVAGSVGVGFDLKAATEQLQLRTNELHHGPDSKNKCKFGEWAF